MPAHRLRSEAQTTIMSIVAGFMMLVFALIEKSNRNSIVGSEVYMYLCGCLHAPWLYPTKICGLYGSWIVANVEAWVIDQVPPMHNVVYSNLTHLKAAGLLPGLKAAIGDVIAAVSCRATASWIVRC